jgi:hypothetical protein
MPSVFDDTILFAEQANERFKETFENGVPPIPSTSYNKQSSGNQQMKIKRLEEENKTLRENL